MDVKTDKANQKTNVLLPTIMGFVGVIVGSVLTFYFSGILWDRQKLFYVNDSLTRKQFELIDRLSKLNGQQPGIQELWINHLKDIPNNTVLSEKLGGYRGEYSSVVFQSSFYFGDKTNEIARKIASLKEPWWEKPREDYDLLLYSMRDDMITQIKRTVKN